jgi:hypothetical protein
VNLHGNIQDENTSSLKNEPLSALMWSHPGIPQNISTMVGSPHKKTASSKGYVPKDD